MNRKLFAVSLAGALSLTGCVVLPTAPMVTALPGSTKGFDQFRADDDYCRGYAHASVAGPSQAASNTAAANAVGSAAIGAAAGAIIGAATGDAGAGAAIGAGSGLLFGSVAGANGLGYSSYALQRQYDRAYVQCMYGHGNRVPARLVYGGRRSGYPAPGYRVPNASPPDQGPPGYAPPDSTAPPDTPPPRL
jgi:Glycine-zipper domain